MEHNESPCRTCDRKSELPGCFRSTKNGDVVAGALLCPTILQYQKDTADNIGSIQCGLSSEFSIKPAKTAVKSGAHHS